MKVLFNQQDLAKMLSLMASVTCLREACSTAEECLNESGEVGVSNHCLTYDMSHLMGKPVLSSGFPTRSDTTRPVQSQKKASSLRFQI